MSDIAELIAVKRDLEVYIKQKKVEQEAIVLAIRKEYLLKDKLETEIKSQCDTTDRLTKQIVNLEHEVNTQNRKNRDQVAAAYQRQREEYENTRACLKKQIAQS